MARRRVWLLVALCTWLVLVLGLWSRNPIGITDNYDGWRIYDGAGLAPASDDGQSAGKGYLVTRFTKAETVRWTETQDRGLWRMYYPSLVSHVFVLLRNMIPNSELSLNIFGYVWAIVFGLTLAFLLRSQNWLPPVLCFSILVLPPFSRFFVSTYAEAPGLIGLTCLLALTPRSVIKTRERNWSHYFLLGLASILIAGSKVAFAPLLMIAVIFFILSAVHDSLSWGWSRMTISFVLIMLTALMSATYIKAMLSSEDRYQSDYVNKHNFVMTVVGTQLGGDFLRDRGMSEELSARVGEAFWPRGSDWMPIPSWEETISNPDWVNSVRFELLTQPIDLLAVVNKSVKATSDPQLSYLSHKSWVQPIAPRSAYLQSALYSPLTTVARFLLSPLRIGLLWPVLLMLSALIIWWRLQLRDPADSRIDCLSISFFGGASGTLACAVAILGDGTYELEKHVVIASLAFAIQVSTLIAVMVATTTRRWCARGDLNPHVLANTGT